MIVINSIFLLSEQATNASGFFEVQILSLTNNRGTLVDGRCCGGGGDGGGKGELPPHDTVLDGLLALLEGIPVECHSHRLV